MTTKPEVFWEEDEDGYGYLYPCTSQNPEMDIGPETVFRWAIERSAELEEEARRLRYLAVKASTAMEEI